jgi:anti-anti-sigma factor
MTDLTTTVRSTDTGTLLELAGELDYHTAPQVREALATITLSAGQQLIINLSGLTFCDSSGIATFIAARNRALAADAGMALATVPDQVTRVLSIIGLSQIITAYTTVEEALQAWAHTTD